MRRLESNIRFKMLVSHMWFMPLWTLQHTKDADGRKSVFSLYAAHNQVLAIVVL